MSPLDVRAVHQTQGCAEGHAYTPDTALVVSTGQPHTSHWFQAPSTAVLTSDVSAAVTSTLDTAGTRCDPLRTVGRLVVKEQTKPTALSLRWPHHWRYRDGETRAPSNLSL
jgi:D-lyxose ketol-isomerase